MSFSTKEISGISSLTIAGAISAVFQLLTVALIARGVDVAGFGVYALAIAYVSIFDRLLNFQSWQALISFGAKYWDRNKSSKDLAGLTAIAVLVDLISAVVATAFALSLINIIGTVFNMPPEFAQAAYTAAYGILFNQTGASTALLRLNESYSQLAMGRVVSAISGTFFAGGVFISEGDTTDYILVYVLAISINTLWLVACSTPIYLRLYRSSTSLFRGSKLYLKSTEARGMIKFLVISNIEGSVKILREIDVIFIGKILGVEAVGIYRISKRIAEVAHLFIDPFYQVILPAMSKSISNRDHRKAIRLIADSARKCSSIVFILLLVFFSIGKYAIAIAFGEPFSHAYELTLIMMLGSLIWAIGAPLVALNLALTRPRNNLVAHLVAAGIFLMCIVVLSREYGLFGAAAATPAFSIVWLSLLTYFSLRSYRQFR